MIDESWSVMGFIDGFKWDEFDFKLSRRKRKTSISSSISSIIVQQWGLFVVSDRDDSADIPTTFIDRVRLYCGKQELGESYEWGVIVGNSDENTISGHCDTLAKAQRSAIVALECVMKTAHLNYMIDTGAYQEMEDLVERLIDAKKKIGHTELSVDLKKIDDAMMAAAKPGAIPADGKDGGK
jgi:hypothetical protein